MSPAAVAPESCVGSSPLHWRLQAPVQVLSGHSERPCSPAEQPAAPASSSSLLPEWHVTGVNARGTSCRKPSGRVTEASKRMCVFLRMLKQLGAEPLRVLASTKTFDCAPAGGNWQRACLTSAILEACTADLRVSSAWAALACAAFTALVCSADASCTFADKLRPLIFRGTFHAQGHSRRHAAPVSHWD